MGDNDVFTRGAAGEKTKHVPSPRQPDTLRLRLVLVTKRQFIESCELFKALADNTEIVIELVRRLTLRVCFPREVIFATDDLGSEMCVFVFVTLRYIAIHT